MEKSGLKFRAERNSDFMIFWAITLLTAVTGIIELITYMASEEIKLPIPFDYLYILSILQELFQIIIPSILYFVFVFIIIYSIERVSIIYKENYDLTYEGHLGSDILDYTKNNPTFIDKLIDKDKEKDIFNDLIKLTIYIIIIFASVYYDGLLQHIF